MKYGLPYKGSKNKLAERIIERLPQAEHLIDMFCGGCAVAHAALVQGKYPHVHINDLNWMCPTLFKDALNGKYADDTRWISREEFERIKTTDPYVAFVWSFGNNLRDYLYSKDIEPLKRAIHYAMYFNDFKPAEALGHDLSFVEYLADAQDKYASIKQYFLSFPSDYNVKRPYEMQNVEHRSRVLQCDNKVQPIRLQSHESKRVYQQTKIDTLHSTLTDSTLDYADVPIPKNSVIYCDIPYKDTNVYKKGQQFDYPRFYNWAMKQTEPVYISSYDMPRKYFECIEEWQHQSIYCATDSMPVTERLFVPRKDIDPYPYHKQLTLF